MPACLPDHWRRTEFSGTSIVRHDHAAVSQDQRHVA
jgi:hypothetical protein